MSHSLPATQTRLLKHDVLQREFSLPVAGESVPCVLWTPGLYSVPHALIALGHGGSQHKTARGICDRAIRYARHFGWASLAIDAPGHGERISHREAQAERRKTLARVGGDTNASSMSTQDKIRYLDSLAAQAVPEWQAALEVTLERFAPTVQTLAYWGVSQGTWIGVPLLAVERRFRCAVLGLAHLHPEHTALKSAAEHISIPLRFAFQWDDPIRVRDYGVALFDAFASVEKSMHINPGGHSDVPASERASWDEFFAHHLN